MMGIYYVMYSITLGWLCCADSCAMLAVGGLRQNMLASGVECAFCVILAEEAERCVNKRVLRVRSRIVNVCYCCVYVLPVI